MGNELLYEYLAGKILQDLISSVPLDNNLAKELNKYPVIDHIRDQVQDVHFSTISKLIAAKSCSKEVKQLAVGLLHKYIRAERHGTEIKLLLSDLWETGDMEEKFHVMWRLLDFGDLEESFHYEMFAFLKSNKDYILSKTLGWCGSEAKILDYAASRLTNKSFPKTKSWIYLFIASLSPDKENAKSLISKYADGAQPVLRRVADEIIDELDSSELQTFNDQVCFC